MPNVKMIRIDSRLIHGQITSLWMQALQADALIVADDEVANDAFHQSLMNLAAPKAIKPVYTTLRDAAGAVDPQKTTLILCKDAQDALTLLQNHITCDVMNIGNMHMQAGKRQVAVSVAVDDADLEAFRQMKEMGAHLKVQRTPMNEEETISELK
ncbi:PTS sugar transporter subunit IIB [Catenisphaera adipataccumulans]|jgi:PTS system N-acetylgalactosamine-specific IIB component|uniref:PTS system N-acetylgalactosamine-specific IIB component n=1 Tax=Catenisphaera adipataccumulans TaxID=700500 RepID=A0A7W8FUU8_9FIRM|nr:PTS sugar transporter subunit IIB [Catenisphaera adipataccumulans]MBB5182934.1 PTS system N-acetylgalactosamine-specific IIB component [Catenisphaera adipataccumulans]